MKPISRIIIIVLLTFLLCETASLFLRHGLKTYNNHSTARLTEILEKDTYYDVLFLGSSRTHSTINPRIIDSVCTVSSYNAGIDGGNLAEFRMIFKAYLQHHPPPALLVLTLGLSSFNLQRMFFNYTEYFPFLNNKVIDTTLSHNGHNTFRQKIFPFLSVTDYDDYSRGNAIKGITDRGGKQIEPGEFQYKGYLSNTNNTLSVQDTPRTIASIKVSNRAIRYLQNIISICREHGTKLIFTYSPEFNFESEKHVSNSAKIFALIDSIAGENKIEFLRHDSLSICQDPKLFANVGHVNTTGAKVYSNILAKQLVKEMASMPYRNSSPASALYTPKK